MPLKTKLVQIPDGGANDTNRDKGKVYLLTEMPASRAEKWGARVVLACGRANVDIPNDAWSQGMAGILAVGILSLVRMSWFDAEPLLDEMFTCVQAIPDPRNTEIIRPLVESDVEEVTTRIMLREEVFKLHTGFMVADVLSMLNSTMTSAEPPSPDTQTSPPQSGQ